MFDVLPALQERVPLRGEHPRKGRFSYEELWPFGFLSKWHWDVHFRDSAGGRVWHYPVSAPSALVAERRCLQVGDWNGHPDRVIVRVERLYYCEVCGNRFTPEFDDAAVCSVQCERVFNEQDADPYAWETSGRDPESQREIDSMDPAYIYDLTHETEPDYAF